MNVLCEYRQGLVWLHFKARLPIDHGCGFERPPKPDEPYTALACDVLAIPGIAHVELAKYNLVVHHGACWTEQEIATHLVKTLQQHKILPQEVHLEFRERPDPTGVDVLEEILHMHLPAALEKVLSADLPGVLRRIADTR